MTCRQLLVLTFAACGGCVDDVPTLYATTTAMTSVELAPPDDHIPQSFGHYRWELAEKPPGASVPAPIAETAAITVVPPTRGIYVYDRWFVGEVSAQLSYHVVVSVDGALPMARVAGPTTVAVGAPAMLDASPSFSPELRTLTFQWRLASRPEVSMTVLADAATATLTFVPDVRGEYGVELRAFDGELWSPPAMVTVVAR